MFVFRCRRYLPLLGVVQFVVTRGGVVLIRQDNMSAAFGAGDFTSSAVAKASAASVRVSEVLGNTISLEEIMNATKTNVRTDYT